jgi:hypothetical protein
MEIIKSYVVIADAKLAVLHLLENGEYTIMRVAKFRFKEDSFVFEMITKKEAELLIKK